MSKHKIGFTGTRHGMTAEQKSTFARLLALFPASEFHHGDCVGADDEAANLAAEQTAAHIICHPPVNEEHRAFNQCSGSVRVARTHFARNREIVAESTILIATPRDSTHQTMGGTWYTVDHAVDRGMTVLVIWPDGKVSVL